MAPLGHTAQTACHPSGGEKNCNFAYLPWTRFDVLSAKSSLPLRCEGSSCLLSATETWAEGQLSAKLVSKANFTNIFQTSSTFPPSQDWSQLEVFSVAAASWDIWHSFGTRKRIWRKPEVVHFSAFCGQPLPLICSPVSGESQIRRNERSPAV